MSTKLIITIPDELSDEEVEDLRFLLSDSVNSFIATRTPEEEYVRLRYQGNPDGRMTTEEKVAQVKRRVALAKKLYRPVSGIELIQGSDDSPVRLVFNNGDPKVLVSGCMVGRNDGLELAKKITEIASDILEDDKPIVRAFTVVKKDD